MNFNFNIGSIVKFGLLGFAAPIYQVGKVSKVTPNEIVIIPQLKVYQKSASGVSSRYAHLNEYCTADDLSEVIHIRRQLIISWTYSKATDEAIKESISEDDCSIRNLMSNKHFSDYTLNMYNKETGICKGKGTNCYTIDESKEPFFFALPVSTNKDMSQKISNSGL